MSKKVVYLDENTRIRYAFTWEAICCRAHRLERRKKTWYGHRWVMTSWMYNSIINGETSWPYLVHWLKRDEAERWKKFKFFGYPNNPA